MTASALQSIVSALQATSSALQATAITSEADAETRSSWAQEIALTKLAKRERVDKDPQQ